MLGFTITQVVVVIVAAVIVARIVTSGRHRRGPRVSAGGQPTVAVAHRYASVATRVTAPKARQMTTAIGDSEWRGRGPDRKWAAWCGVSRRTYPVMRPRSSRRS